ncbi:hypothetical protein [Tautonia sociabilis]|uniref:Uncharacterized protein n=1 Tax=Tautonia sociabilis TaxID=2080755 RepID=A0A432MDW1_9BACT|nr:hypothetical protein [Tautonia sociabilis]RUL83186.1 hypothetical protein TsocGM_22585 [Tautonia sociabilis]
MNIIKGFFPNGAMAAGLLLAGCEPPTGNRSPNALDNPERAARARAQAEDVERANREAEAAFYRSLRVAAEPEAEDPASTRPAVETGRTPSDIED